MKQLMLGNEAIARGVYEAGAKVASAYPGTPSTEITEYIAEYDEIYSEWAPNEKVALEVAIGASVGGARATCAMKHVGLNVAADPLFTAAYTGVNGGLVIFVADDPGMHSSQNEQDTRLIARAAKVPVLEPSDSQECKDFTRKAFEISEQFDTPIIVRLTTRVAHSQGLVELGEREDIPLKPYAKDPGKYVMMPAMARKRHVVVEERLEKLTEYSNETPLNHIEWGDRKIGVITSGIAYQYAKEAFGNASFLKLGMVYPLPEKLIREFAAGVETIYVIEELEPFIEDHCLKMGIPVKGKALLPLIGEYNANLIRERILGQKAEKLNNIEEEVPVRPPVMCPGCPHRGLFYVLKKLKLTVTGDIGCYTLGTLAPLESMDTCVCMGASVGMAHGMEKAMGRDAARKTVAVIGDSTFIHSGITGLIDIVYNKGTSTVVILDNSITGMTGHQHNPTTGFTIKGEPTRQVDLVKLCQAVGVDRVRVCDPFDLETLEKVIKEEVAADEPSVVIAQRPCALLKHVKFNGALRIDREKCTRCKMCMRLGCPAIVDRGTHVEVNPALCVGCDLCTKVCRFNAFERVGGDHA
ncbi:MAG TPA: indolepyruvate ferredoxin oxidoreductase subunit alpha [Thermoclostridium caenicola]|uniref:indolepyruvate ferredoxin oxidoreductase subunit alpha n=1 Tax=Thermoclostridium caenicola TaxID=659425 RepID=UPI002C225551|nr:indolepyruvate ferredoxin oxidoreductase subunit alpha [Thermoclostridium caenicola]HOK43709.1 indolepyruvate ferredoxin oxidoreductase subunit alpha [Thermoclostridium caenicola]HOL85633.1 indolepyruvate ferredoxin oxidoreductase subunit alpha [Thermoclostridium caenicola]HPO77691.1 indolepyruvate ferredoxin oxidoreductase subunit alpha [Thermoclostridium caenicola]